MPDFQRLRNAFLLGDTAWRHLAEDPLLLVVQASRRLPASTRAVTSRLVGAGAAPTGVRRALAEFVADRPRAAAQALAAVEPGSALGRRVAAELAVQVGDAALVPGGVETAGPSVRARELRSRGHLSRAVHVLDGAPRARAQRARLRSEMATMSPRFALPGVVPSPAWSGPARRARPRVLHVLTNSLPRTQSGYAVRSHAVLRSQVTAGIEARAVTRVGYPVTVGLVGAAREDRVDGVIYRRLLPARLAPTSAARLVQMTRLLAREVEEFRPDVLHTTTNYQNALVTRAVARSYGLPWVYEMRGVLEYTWVARRPAAQEAEALASERFSMLRAKETEMAVEADAVIVLSRVQREDLIARGIPAERISVVPNAVEAPVLEAPRLLPADARQAVGLPRAGFWVGSVSSLVDYEGFGVLLRAVARCREQGADVRCALAGDGVSRPGLAALAADLGLGGEVCVLPGRVDHRLALDWYQVLDVFCVPRLDTPVCRMVTPLKPLTAMALGRPVVASALPALAEVIEPGCGRSFPPGDAEALARILTAMATGGPDRDPAAGTTRTTAPLPTWEKNGIRNAEMYEELR
ncbi:glycosyltransferase [Actinomyces israelii]|uniref:Glycosyltransferase n=1 Tax=Actinomyces israelii TaxID=1659 RepID=A0ABT4IB30_9ACTO|nr:glycosyltransferase [Actinomyces israelii]MCZ0858943.1 glycosyltransferase [Actinomyces israelii]